MDLASLAGFVTEMGSVTNAMSSLAFMTTGLYRVKKSSYFINTKSSLLRKVTVISFVANFLKMCTICPGSSDPFYIVSYCIKFVTTSWTQSNIDIDKYYLCL